jgi:hypothetical protein
MQIPEQQDGNQRHERREHCHRRWKTHLAMVCLEYLQGSAGRLLSLATGREALVVDASNFQALKVTKYPRSNAEEFPAKRIGQMQRSFPPNESYNTDTTCNHGAALTSLRASIRATPQLDGDSSCAMNDVIEEIHETTIRKYHKVCVCACTCMLVCKNMRMCTCMPKPMCLCALNDAIEEIHEATIRKYHKVCCVYVCTQVHACMHVRMRMRMCMCTLCLLGCTHAYIHVHGNHHSPSKVDTHTYAYIHTCTGKPSLCL